ncbi:multicopper oxidase domain-containing protein [Phytohabitans houttuyneae]|jgi:plastocyanin|uniref:multicopper oxidase domain-containing protein n=1 Tax=Phytohabitans houttuyneae TaxID=1076126 RepID=UPI00156725B0|nr:multicopper oxidase domain-containing protein [Phytohabitans houttuyneae]
MSDTSLPDRLGAVRRLLRNPSRPVRRLAVVLGVVIATFIAGVAIFAPRMAMAANHTITIKNFTFTPEVLNVSPGDTVTFVNQETDGTLHTIRGDFTSPDLPPGASFTVTITGTRSYSYFCGNHPYMLGTINSGSAPPTTTAPTPTTAAPTTAAPTTSPPTTGPVPTTPVATPTGTASPTPPPSGTPPCQNPTVGAEQGDGTRLATFEVVGGVKVFKLCMAPLNLQVSAGVIRPALAFNGIVPGPTIKVNEGDKLRFIVQNNMTEHTAVHWHGMELPNAQDGVPDITQPHIMPGEIYTYEWTAKSTGTHWYHSHMGGSQVGKGLYGALLITPTLGDITADKHYTVEIGDGSNGFTLNGRSYPATVPLSARLNQKVHIRLIGTGPEMLHPMHLHGMPFQVVAQDGIKITSPYTVDTLTVAPGQTFDIVFQPKEVGKWLLHCHVFSHSEGPNGMVGLVTVLDITA